MTKIAPDDFAKLHYNYHEDTDLEIVADTLEEEHGAEGSYLVWLYWPRMISSAKAAKSFGWFSFTPKKLSRSVGDTKCVSGWDVRARMFDLLAGRDLIRIRQGVIESPSAKVDVLLPEYEKWQSLTNGEHQKLVRERKRVAAGEEVHWTLRHWSAFAFHPISSPTNSEANDVIDLHDVVMENHDVVTGSHDAVMENHSRVTPQDETRRDETRQETNTSSSAEPTNDHTQQIRDLFDLWVSETNRNPNQNRLTKGRRSLVRGRLRDGYTIEQLQQAITGIAGSPWHAGQNPNGTRYDTFDFIFRSGENIEKGLERAAGPTPASSTPVSITGNTRHNVSREYDDGIQWHDNDGEAA